jgi:hypothetical protein
MNQMELAKIIGTLFVGVVAIVFLSFLLSWPVYMLWNGCLVGAVRGITEVTWLQAWGLTVLFGFLFKSSNTKTK